MGRSSPARPSAPAARTSDWSSGIEAAEMARPRRDSCRAATPQAAATFRSSRRPATSSIAATTGADRAVHDGVQVDRDGGRGDEDDHELEQPRLAHQGAEPSVADERGDQECCEEECEDGQYDGVHQDLIPTVERCPGQRWWTYVHRYCGLPARAARSCLLAAHASGQSLAGRSPLIALDGVPPPHPSVASREEGSSLQGLGQSGKNCAKLRGRSLSARHICV